MALIKIKDADSLDVQIEAPNSNGRAAASGSRPVALSTEDLAALTTLQTLLSTLGTKQDSTTSAVNSLAGAEYETVAAGQTNQTLGATGATGDLLTGVLVIPASTSPGAIAIKDGGNTAINVFAGGASSISSLHPFFIPLGVRSGAGAWQLTTGANVSAIAVGNFT